MRKALILFLVMSLMVMGAAAVMADDDAATDDGVVNWCSDADVWGDGRCSDSDPEVSMWYWTCGWYGAAYEAGIVDSVIDICPAPTDPDNAG